MVDVKIVEYEGERDVLTVCYYDRLAFTDHLFVVRVLGESLLHHRIGESIASSHWYRYQNQY
jgi:hypothetical protein